MRSPSIRLLFALALVFSHPACAYEVTVKDVTVADPWTRATQAGETTAAVYFQMRAAPGTDDRLIGASSPVATSTEIQTRVGNGGNAHMRRVDSVALPSGATVTFAPDSHQIALIGLKDPLNKGETFRITLVFEKAGRIEVEGTIEAIGATGPPNTEAPPQPRPSPPRMDGQK